MILACVAVASAQYNSGQYKPYTTPRPVYKYTPYVSSPPPFKYQPYKPYSTPAPFAPVVVSTAAPVYNVPVAKQVADSRSAQIVKYSNEINPDGSYNYL